MPDSFQPWVHISLTRQWVHVGQMNSMLAKISPDASVSATTYIIPHLSSRREIIRLPALQLSNDERQVVNVDYAVADLWQLQQYQVAFKDDRRQLQAIAFLIDRVFANQEYGIVGFKDGVILMQKSATSNPASVTAWLAFRQEIAPILQP